MSISICRRKLANIELQIIIEGGVVRAVRQDRASVERGGQVGIAVLDYDNEPDDDDLADDTPASDWIEIY